MLHFIEDDDSRGFELLLAHPAEDLQRHDLDRYVLLQRFDDEDWEKIFRPHDTILLHGREMLAGDVVLSWLNNRSRTLEDEVLAARSFFGWHTPELSANQKLFVAEAEERGYRVNCSYFPKNSYGQNCPAIYIGFNPCGRSLSCFNFDGSNDGTGMNAVCEVNWASGYLFARP